MGPKMLALAGSAYDGTVLSWESPAGIAKQSKIVRDAAKEAGRPEPHVGAYIRIAMDKDREAARKALAEGIAWYWPHYAKHFEALDLGPSFAKADAAYAKGGVDAAAAELGDDVLLSLGWYGTPDDDIGPFLEEYEQAGVNHLIGRVVPVGDPGQTLTHVLAAFS